MLALHDEVMGIGYLRSLYHLLHRGILHAECYVVVESVVEEYCLLVYVAYELAQVTDANLAYVLAVNEYLAARYVVVTWYEVNEC